MTNMSDVEVIEAILDLDDDLDDDDEVDVDDRDAGLMETLTRYHASGRVTLSPAQRRWALDILGRYGRL